MTHSPPFVERLSSSAGSGSRNTAPMVLLALAPASARAGASVKASSKSDSIAAQYRFASAFIRFILMRAPIFSFYPLGKLLPHALVVVQFSFPRSTAAYEY